MRIAQVSPLYESVPPKFYGGTERVVSYLTEEMVRLGHEVTLFASGDSVTRAELISPCKRSLRLDPECKDPLVHHLMMLDRVIRESPRFDFIHWHIDYLHFPFSRTSSMPHVTTLHGRLDLPDLQNLYREFTEMPLVSISDAQREPISWANWTGTVHHGLPPHEFDFNPKPGGYLAFLGRISPEKRPDLAIEIAKAAGRDLKIAAKVSDADAQYYEGAIKPLLDHPLIEFVGEINDSEKEEFLGGADALLFPIDWPEPFGLVMIEAMACGTPVIAFRRGSVPEILEDGVSGFIVENARGAVEAVHKLPLLRRQSCREQFERRFTSQRMAGDYIAVYEHVMGLKSRVPSDEQAV